MLTKADGRLIVSMAREAIEKFVGGEVPQKPEDYPASFERPAGVFVTIHKGTELRGCIGMPYPVMPLIKALLAAAVSAASEDPRFEPVSDNELKKIKIEVSVLTEPKQIMSKPEDYHKHIKIGETGLIVIYGPYSGLLLPQVASEHGWDAEEFLDNCCIKAGMLYDMWKDQRTKVYTFQAQVFREE
jgi:uncharacterized protein (TIGR00296 family)